MNRFFYFYPHCFLKSTDKEVLVYDTMSKLYVYLKASPLSRADRETFQMGYVKVSESLNDFVNLCLSNELGYFVEFERVLPFFESRGLEFVTSLSKERKALGYNLHSHTNSILREVTIQLKNSKDDYSDEMCLQIEYPKFNNESINLDFILQQLSSFQYLENIIIAGEIEKSELEKTLKYAEDYNIRVVHRIMFDSFNYALELKLIDRYDIFSIELLIDNSVDTAKIEHLSQDKIYVKAIVKTINDVQLFDRMKSVMYEPVLSRNHNNKDIISQMILSEDEILSTSKSIKDCIIADCVNPSIFGHLTIDNGGFVYVLGKRIASVFESDLSSIVNRWVGQDNCLWYKTRREKSKCKDCALQCLCPPISIYEELGLFENACTI